MLKGTEESPHPTPYPDLNAVLRLVLSGTQHVLGQRPTHREEWGRGVSKPAAARWAQETLGDPWADLIARALRSPGEPETARLRDTLDFIRFTLARTRQFEPTRETHVLGVHERDG